MLLTAHASDMPHTAGPRAQEKAQNGKPSAYNTDTMHSHHHHHHYRYESAPLVEVLRGGAFEKRHRGWIVACDTSGRVCYEVGNSKQDVFSRSALKPFQALPLVLKGAHKAYDLSAEDLALVCASHGGQPEHVARVAQLLAKVGLNAEHLQCGPHTPLHGPSAQALQGAFTALHNNCSGKHAGMLLTCVHQGWDLATYLEPNHPLQQEIRTALQAFTGLSPEGLTTAVDGCSAPNYSFPLMHLATAFARLGTPTGLLDYAEATAVLAQAMRSAPFYVAGDARFDTALMAVVPGIIAKSGAAGVIGIATLDGELGLAIKMEDGNREMLALVVIETLSQLHLIQPAQAEALAAWHPRTLYNWRQQPVGEICPRFQI